MTKKTLIIILLLTIPLVIIAGAIGFYSSSNKKLPVRDEQTAPTKKLTPIPVASWKTFSNADFSLNYPNDWHLTAQKITSGQFQQEITSLSASGSAVITIRHQVFNPKRPNVDIDVLAQQKFASSSGQTRRLTIGKHVLTAYVPDTSADRLVNYLTIPYMTASADYYEISFYYLKGQADEDYPELFEDIIKTLNFK